MPRKKESPPDSRDLRKKAEKVISKNPKKPAAPSVEDLPKLVHELQVHQIELEMQNDELQRQQAESEEAKDRYLDLYDFAPIGYFTFDSVGRIAEVNLTGASLLGLPRSRLVGNPFGVFVESDFYALFHKHLKEVLSGLAPHACELKLKSKPGKSPVYVSLESIASEKGDGVECRSAVTDITDRKRVEAALRQSESKFRLLFENSPDAVLLTVPEGVIVAANPAARALFGMTEEEICRVGRKGLLDESYPVYRAAVEERKKTGRAVGVEMKFIRKNGEMFIGETSSVILPGQEPRAFVMIRDISKRKQLEEELRRSRDELEMRVGERTRELDAINQNLKAENEERLNAELELRDSEDRLRRLSSELLNAQEKERRLVAQEIHDSIGSSLAATKFKIEEIITAVGENRPNTRVALESILPSLQQSIDETRRIQLNLRPSMLDDIGVLATISWFCRQYKSTYSSIHIGQEIAIEEREIPESLKTVIFRVLQEAMNNIAKHSKASVVLLHLSKTDRTIHLTIRDNGKGFALSETRIRDDSTRGLGLIGMGERVELSGGSFAMESSPGKGTEIRASWPLDGSI